MKTKLKFVLLLLLLVPASALAQPSFPTDPKNAEVVATDVKNFLEALERSAKGGDRKKILQEYYFDRATPGLKEYISRFGLDAEKLDAAIGKDPANYRDLAAFYDRLSEFEAVLKGRLSTLKEIHPNAMFAPTYLLVGANRGIGQASRVGQLVTVERRSGDLDVLASLSVHEVIHFQQAMALGPQAYQALYSAKDNMLGLVLREGAAEFITYKLVNGNERAFMRLDHLKLNENQLWDRFRRDLRNQDKAFWLDVSFEDGNKGYPYLLGYAIGYRIVEAYFEGAADKEKAFQDILAIRDSGAFLNESGYTPKMTKLQKEFAFGMPDPEAPPQLLEYRELIGISDCSSRSRALDGTWGEPQEMVWSFRYILGGTAVEDSTVRSDGFHAGSVRQYSPDDGSWYVHYFSTQKNKPATLPSWKGGRQGNEIRLTRDQKAPNGAEGYYKIRFYDISDSGFKWLGAWESKDGSVVFENWTIDCKKRAL